MPTPEPISVTAALGVLTDLGVAPVIVLGAVIAFASLLYKRFRK